MRLQADFFFALKKNAIIIPDNDNQRSLEILLKISYIRGTTPNTNTISQTTNTKPQHFSRAGVVPRQRGHLQLLDSAVILLFSLSVQGQSGKIHTRFLGLLLRLEFADLQLKRFPAVGGRHTLQY